MRYRTSDIGTPKAHGQPRLHRRSRPPRSFAGGEQGAVVPGTESSALFRASLCTPSYFGVQGKGVSRGCSSFNVTHHWFPRFLLAHAHYLASYHLTSTIYWMRQFRDVWISNQFHHVGMVPCQRTRPDLHNKLQLRNIQTYTLNVRFNTPASGGGTNPGGFGASSLARYDV